MRTLSILLLSVRPEEPLSPVEMASRRTHASRRAFAGAQSLLSTNGVLSQVRLQPRDPAHIGMERFGDVDAAVGLLIIFEDCDERAPDREARAVERVDELVALRALAAEARVHAPCLEIRSEEHTSELQSLMRISYAVFCLKK